MTADTPPLELSVPAVHAGRRLDQCLAEMLPEHSRVFLQRLVRDGGVGVNGATCLSPRRLMADGDALSVAIPPSSPPALIAERIALPVLYEDGALLVIDKPAGMVCHPAAGNWGGTVVNALLGRDAGFAEFAGDAGDLRPGIVHRLDKDTSGCLVVAKNAKAQAVLAAAFAARRVGKTYLALVSGAPNPPSGTLQTLIGRHPADRKRMAVLKSDGREAVTSYETIAAGAAGADTVSLLKVVIGTGRTHQIRVHMTHLGCPVAGDLVYGGRRTLPAARQMLHAWRLELRHPLTGAPMLFISPPPADFADFAAMAGLAAALPAADGGVGGRP